MRSLVKIIEIPIFVLLVFFVSGNTRVLAATTYYVDTNNNKASDSNPGSQALPWKTIGKASTTMVAGDTVLVLAGTYNELVSTTRSGTSAGRITFKALGVANISGSNVDIKHDYITIDGFTLTGSELDIYAGNFCEILNNKIEVGAIQMHYLNSSDLPTRCLIKGNHLYGSASPEGDWPMIEIYGSHHVIENNEIGPNSDIDAFRLWGHDNIIRSNYIHDQTYSPNSRAHMDGFQIFGDNGWDSYNQIIENNRFINSEGQLFMTSHDNVAGIHDIILRNNVFANYGQNANIGIRNMSFLNNTFYNVGIFGGVENTFGTSAGTVFKNNIFVGIQGYNLTDYDANLFMHSVPWIFENNFFSTSSGAALKNFNQQEQIRGINGGAINFTNVAVNDFSLKSTSPVIDKGVSLSGFNYDLDGKVRSQGAGWDIGAYEYGAGSTTTPPPPPPLQPPSNLIVK